MQQNYSNCQPCVQNCGSFFGNQSHSSLKSATITTKSCRNQKTEADVGMLGGFSVMRVGWERWRNFSAFSALKDYVKPLAVRTAKSKQNQAGKYIGLFATSQERVPCACRSLKDGRLHDCDLLIFQHPHDQAIIIISGVWLLCTGDSDLFYLSTLQTSGLCAKQLSAPIFCLFCAHYCTIKATQIFFAFPRQCTLVTESP